VGDLIVTEKSASSPVSVHVGEVPKFLAHVGRHKGNRAVRILRPIGPADRV
jgi:flagellar motor switch protein FliM